MFRRIRILLQTLFFVGLVACFLDFTGTVHRYLGWLARVQVVPAVLMVNAAVLVALAVLTLLMGRVYCSTLCPLGTLQDVVWRVRSFKLLGYKVKPSGSKTGAKANNLLTSKLITHNSQGITSKLITHNSPRYIILALFVVCLVAGVTQVCVVLDPYAIFGRGMQSLVQPVYVWGNNVLAGVAERAESYAFYGREVWMRSLWVLLLSAGMWLLVAVLAWRGGRTWCNGVCPVGTLLGLLSRFAWYRPRIDVSRCNGCGQCARRCKASCINARTHEIDLSRCVMCGDCEVACRQGALRVVMSSKLLGYQVKAGASGGALRQITQ